PRGKPRAQVVLPAGGRVPHPRRSSEDAGGRTAGVRWARAGGGDRGIRRAGVRRHAREQHVRRRRILDLPDREQGQDQQAALRPARGAKITSSLRLTFYGTETGEPTVTLLQDQ